MQRTLARSAQMRTRRSADMKTCVLAGWSWSTMGSPGQPSATAAKYAWSAASLWGAASFVGVTMTAAAPRSRAIWLRATVAWVPACDVPTQIGNGRPAPAAAATAASIMAARSASVSRLLSPRTPAIVHPSAPASAMKATALAKPSRSRLSSGRNGVAMMGQTPVNMVPDGVASARDATRAGAAARSDARDALRAKESIVATLARAF
mmetsp:Transcript_34673/g.117540  ORF Transcript_34673/g.117540 Transcript_34673/m.117540 type:complete len:207 (+) Transcript_34673:324-944(+)